MAQDECGGCQKPVTNNCNGVECGKCQAWYHVGCGVMRGIKHSQMKVLECDSIFFICRDCQEAVKREWSRRNNGKRRGKTLGSDPSPVVDEEMADNLRPAAEENIADEEADENSQPQVRGSEEVEGVVDVASKGEERDSDHSYHIGSKNEQGAEEVRVTEDPEELATTTTTTTTTMVTEASEEDTSSASGVEYVSFTKPEEDGEEERATEMEEITPLNTVVQTQESIEETAIMETREAAEGEAKKDEKARKMDVAVQTQEITDNTAVPRVREIEVVEREGAMPRESEGVARTKIWEERTVGQARKKVAAKTATTENTNTTPENEQDKPTDGKRGKAKETREEGEKGEKLNPWATTGTRPKERSEGWRTLKGRNVAADTRGRSAEVTLQNRFSVLQEEGAVGGEERLADKEKVKERSGEAAAAEKENQGPLTWLGVGQHTWKKVLYGAKLRRKPGKQKERMWIFGDSILSGMDAEIGRLTAGYYEVMDRTESGARVFRIKEMVKSHLSMMKPSDLVVVEGGGNGLEVVSVLKTLEVLQEIVQMVKKVGGKVLLMCVPRRQKKEGTVYEEMRRWLNNKCLDNLDEWGCDGLQLWEGMSWRYVLENDGVHLSSIGKAWTGWSLVDWARHRGRKRE